MRAGILLLLLALAGYLPLASGTVWQGTEGRRVQIVQEMTATGDYLVPTLGHEPTLAKPPFYYWVLSAMEQVFGRGQLPMRLPSILSLWLFAWLAAAVLGRTHGHGAGLVAGVGVLCSPAIVWHGAFAEIDPMFAALTAASILTLAYSLFCDCRYAMMGAGALGGLALVTKGPPYLMFLLGALLVWWRHRRLWGWYWFVPFLLLAPVTYYGLMFWGSGLDPEEVSAIAARESVGRITSFELRHVLDTPMHLVRSVLVTLPLGLWTLAEFRSLRDARMERSDLVLRICAAAMVGGVLVLVFFPARPVRYLLPGVLTFTVAVAPAVAAFARFPAALREGQRAIVRVFGVLGALALLVLPWFPVPMVEGSLWLALVLALAPLLVAERAHLVAYALAVPLLIAWTVLPDRFERYAHGVRSPVDSAVLLRQEMERLQVDPARLATWGHMSSPVLLEASLDLPGDEFLLREPDADWLLLEDSDRIVEEYPERLAAAGYRERVRIRGRRRSFVLLQRAP